MTGSLKNGREKYDSANHGVCKKKMGAIAAVMHKNGQNAADRALIMLKELSHRGKERYGIAAAKQQTLAGSLIELNSATIRSSVILGYVFSKTLTQDKPQLITTDNFTIALDGRTYPPSEIRKNLLSNAEKTAEAIIKSCHGDYAFAIAASDSIIVGRDVMGIVPLYFAQDKTVFAFASERKALWKLGLDKTKSFPPGSIAVVKNDGSFSLKPIRRIALPASKLLTTKSTTKQLQKLLLRSIKNRISGVKEAAVAFSGGLDSSLVALLAREHGLKVHLITVGSEDALENRHVEEAAEALAMPMHMKNYTIDDVEKVLPKVLWLIEEPNPIQASIATPLYWAAEQAKACGFRVLFTGQGADELFGGYHRYLSIFAENGEKALQKILFNDIARCYETNFQRDNQICVFHGVELRLPFADKKIVDLALSLPLRRKIESPTDKLRKRILRKVAGNFGLPSFIVNKHKKAIQYTTGVDKALRKLARRENLNPSDYVKKVFSKVFRNVN